MISQPFSGAWATAPQLHAPHCGSRRGAGLIPLRSAWRRAPVRCDWTMDGLDAHGTCATGNSSFAVQLMRHTNDFQRLGSRVPLRYTCDSPGESVLNPADSGAARLSFGLGNRWDEACPLGRRRIYRRRSAHFAGPIEVRIRGSATIRPAADRRRKHCSTSSVTRRVGLRKKPCESWHNRWLARLPQLDARGTTRIASVPDRRRTRNFDCVREAPATADGSLGARAPGLAVSPRTKLVRRIGPLRIRMHPGLSWPGRRGRHWLSDQANAQGMAGLVRAVSVP